MPWGTAKPQGLPVIVKTVGDADVTLTAGSDITGFTPAAALVAPYAGSWAYMVWMYAVIALGATAPSAITVKLKTATPTTLDTETIPVDALVNSAIVPYTFCLVGTASSTLYFPTGDTPLITLNCTGQAATLNKGSRAVFSFWPVGD